MDNEEKQLTREGAIGLWQDEKRRTAELEKEIRKLNEKIYADARKSQDEIVALLEESQALKFQIAGLNQRVAKLEGQLVPQKEELLAAKQELLSRKCFKAANVVLEQSNRALKDRNRQLSEALEASRKTDVRQELETARQSVKELRAMLTDKDVAQAQLMEDVKKLHLAELEERSKEIGVLTETNKKLIRELDRLREKPTVSA